MVRGDIRRAAVRAGVVRDGAGAYGILQSLIEPSRPAAALASVARVIRPGGTFGIDLVPDVPNWREYKDRVQLAGRAGAEPTSR